MRYLPPAVRRFAATLLAAAGMDDRHATVVADILVTGDLLGHPTHGVALLPSYLRDLGTGDLVGVGKPEIIRDQGPTAVWDGRWLSGVWLTATALDAAADKADRYGVGVIAIRRAHHTACLQAYLERATSRGMVASVSCSDPANATVAPHGGLRPVFSPDPIAVGIPTDSDPVLIDMSSSITANGIVKQASEKHERLPGPWLADAAGDATDDPTVLFTDPPGVLLPTGGLDHGHKGYALALAVESLTQGLGGYGRAAAEARWSSAVLVQVFDPQGFAGRDAFITQTSELLRRARTSPPRRADAPVRVPGEAAQRRRRQAEAAGIPIAAGTIAALRGWAKQYGVELPSAAGSDKGTDQ